MAKVYTISLTISSILLIYLCFFTRISIVASQVTNQITSAANGTHGVCNMTSLGAYTHVTVQINSQCRVFTVSIYIGGEQQLGSGGRFNCPGLFDYLRCNCYDDNSVDSQTCTTKTRLPRSLTDHKLPSRFSRLRHLITHLQSRDYRA